MSEYLKDMIQRNLAEVHGIGFSRLLNYLQNSDLSKRDFAAKIPLNLMDTIFYTGAIYPSELYCSLDFDFSQPTVQLENSISLN